MANENKGNQSPGEIRREIQETRSHMERNVQALQTRLDPERLKSEANDTIREKTVGRVEDFAEDATETMKGTSADVFDTIKENPLPAALAAIGLGWLFMERRNTGRMSMPSRRSLRRRGQGRSYYEEGYGYRDPELYAGDYPAGYEYGDYESGYGERGRGYRRQPMGQVADRARDGMRQAAGSVSDTAGQVASSVGDTASQVASSVSDTASQVASNVGDTASQVASQARQQAGELADAAQRGAYQAKSRFEELLDENPLLVGAAAVALGAAIGMSLPRTPKEDQLLGQARDSFMEKAQNKATDTLQKVQQVAEKASTAAKEVAKSEAQNQNLTS